jgi:glycosyltransferase involved in cell wall biosynthesis
MSGSIDQAVLSLLEEDNQRLRIALAEAEARAADSPHAFILRDALTPAEEPLVCRHRAEPGRISVVIPAYNAESFLERSVRSVWAQTYPRERIELLIVDDGSRDRTRAIAERLSSESPVATRVLSHSGGRNRGVAPTRQLAASEATGELVALLDADDVFLPERLALTADALVASPDAPAVCSLGRNVTEDGEQIVGHNGTSVAGEWRTLGEELRPPFSFDQLWRVDPIANSSLTIRRSALEAVGGFPTLMAHQAEDWLLVLKLSLVAPIPCIDRKLILYTHHPGAYTHAYHGGGWRDGARLELFYHLAWWMLRSPKHAENGARFFRREYPRQIAEHQRLLPLVREYFQSGGCAAAGIAALGQHIDRQSAELDTLRRVVQSKLQENKQLRQIIAARGAAGAAAEAP